MPLKQDTKYDVQNHESQTANPLIRYLVLTFVILIGCSAVWRLAIYQTDVERGLAELRLANRKSRTLESRLSGIDHSPWTIVRGDQAETSTEPLNRAENILTMASTETGDPSSTAALGKVYLATGKFEQANSLFERASHTDKNNAEIYSDWGASLLELGKIKRVSGERAKSVELFDQALGRLDNAIKLVPGSLEARFNRALCLESLYLAEEAKKAWSDYIAADNSSDWAVEARQKLVRFGGTNDVDADKLQEDFIAAAAIGDRVTAWNLLSANRELIARKYLPQNLAMAITEADHVKRESLVAALELAGELESENINDEFAGDLARYYRRRSEAELIRLREAQTAVKNGYKLCLELRYSDALAEFSRARAIFEQENDPWEANIAAYFVGYCQVQNGEGTAGSETIGKAVDFASRRKFKWLEMTTLYWLAGSKRLLRHQAESVILFKRALAIAETIDDKYAIQRNLQDLALESEFLGQRSEALGYCQRMMETAFAAASSERQRARNATYAMETFSSFGLFHAARAAATEAIAVADAQEDPMFRSNSRSFASLTFMRAGDMEIARTFAAQSLDIAGSIKSERSRNKITALANLRAAAIAERSGDIPRSTQLFRAADEALEVEKISYYQYVAKKGLLYGLNSLGETDELDRRLPTTIALIEEYRGNIDSEKERTSFFDNGVTVFDIAVERALNKGDLAAAFNYAERSTSRELVQRLSSAEGKASSATLLEPLELGAIRERMDPNVQIVRFTVLEKRLLIWVISKAKFDVVSVNVDADVLRKKVEDYVQMVRRGLPGDASAIATSGQELYDILVSPVSSHLEASLELRLVPTKFLYYLPFAALPDRSGQPLIRSFALGYSPSASVFALTSTRAASRASNDQESLLAIGNPAFSRLDFPDIPYLRSAESEVTGIAANYANETVLMNDKARKDAILKSIRSAEIVHFAGHYVAVDRNPASSYLLLASASDDAGDSVLTNEELDKIRLEKTKLVILSACDTGSENYYDGEGMVGLSRTFLAVGVPVVVASQWSVDSEATSELMKRFHANRRIGKMNTARALQAAQLELASDPDGRFNSPYYWAAFGVFGGYSTY
mgnify:CR=1 FL=1